MANPGTFSVMTFNLRFGLADDGPNCWENRKRVYPPLFEAYQPDFIGFQEVNNFQADFLCRLLDGYDFIGRRESSSRSWQNNLIFYRKQWTCRAARHLFLSSTPRVESRLDGSRWPRQCTLGLFEQGKMTVVMANTHFDFSEAVQVRSAGLVVDFLSKFSPESSTDLPTVVTGDFNSLPGGGAHRAFVDNGFEDAFENAHTYTFHGFTGRDRGGHIDWILFRGGITPLNRKIVRERFSGLFPSDHFPVLVEFTR